MIEFLILVLTVAITFLITDFRRWLEIYDLKASHEAQMDKMFDVAFDSGYEMGEMLGALEVRLEYRNRTT